MNKKKKPIPVSKQPQIQIPPIQPPASEPDKKEEKLEPKPEPEPEEDVFILDKQGRKLYGMLTIQNGDYKGETFLLNKRNIKIGKKSSACDIVLKGSDTVSREHSKINFKKNSFLLLDLGSSNGTLLNNYKIEQPEKLEHGDKIEIGDIILEFSLKER